MAKKFYNSCSSLLESGYNKKNENDYISLYKYPRMGNYSYLVRLMEGKSLTYFTKDIENNLFVGKYLSYSSPSYIQLCGLPITERNKESVINGILCLERLLNSEYLVKAILSEYELALYKSVTKMNISEYSIVYRDSEFFDDIDICLSKYVGSKNKSKYLRGYEKDPSIEIRKLGIEDLYDMEMLLLRFKKYKSANLHRKEFYHNLISSVSELNYNMYGLYYKDSLFCMWGYYTAGDIARSDIMISSVEGTGFYDEVPKKYISDSKHIMKHFIYSKLKEEGISKFCVDGAASDELRKHKRSNYTNEIKRYMIHKNRVR